MSDYPEILQDLADKATVFLVAEGLEQQCAKEVGSKLAEHVRKEWGGQMQYIPRGTRYQCSLRDFEIFDKFKGDNYDQLAREYDMSEMRVRQIVAAVRQEEMKKRQQGLF